MSFKFDQDLASSTKQVFFSQELAMDLILASNSPRRHYLLDLMGLDFEVIAADVDESVAPEESPQDYVLRLAEDKARAVAALIDREAIIISADTTVVDRGEILGKPIDPSDAEHMLRRLRGRTHQVYTGLAVLHSKGKTLMELCSTDVPMRSYSDDEIQEYIDSDDPLDKAGAYAIQHTGFHPVDGLQGCYANVVGLPLCHLTRALRKAGLKLDENISISCQTALNYDCSVYTLILREKL